jgi:hypothetical protein
MDELRAALDDLGRAHQIALELADRAGKSAHQDFDPEFLPRLRRLAAKLTPDQIDALERDRGYVDWVLDLAPLVRGGHPTTRARRLLDHPDASVRYRARAFLDQAAGGR